MVNTKIILLLSFMMISGLFGISSCLALNEDARQTLNASELAAGYTWNMYAGKILEFKLESVSYTFQYLRSVGDSIDLRMTMPPRSSISGTLKSGEEKKFDLNSDGFYDLYVGVSTVTSLRANITLKSVHEAVAKEQTPEEQPQPPQEPSAGEQITNEADNKPKETIYEFNYAKIIIGLFIVILLIAAFIFLRRRKE